MHDEIPPVIAQRSQGATGETTNTVIAGSTRNPAIPSCSVIAGLTRNPTPNEAGRVMEPDGYQRLWVPHRMVYINGEKKPADTSEQACPFCADVIAGLTRKLTPEAAQAAKDLLVVARGEYCYVILNLFPYNSGHLLVLPYRHISGYIDLTDDETAEFSKMTKQAIHALTKAYSPQGFNLGMNQGAIAGAGIAAHLHQHIVPRWTGDANFLPIIAQTKALPEILMDTRNKVAAAWPDHKGLQ